MEAVTLQPTGEVSLWGFAYDFKVCACEKHLFSSLFFFFNGVFNIVFVFIVEI